MKIKNFGQAEWRHERNWSDDAFLFPRNPLYEWPWQPLIANRLNGERKSDRPSRAFPRDGKHTWIKGKPTPIKESAKKAIGTVHNVIIYGVKEEDGYHHYEVRYDAGPEDIRWFEEMDRNYILRLAREGRLLELEPNADKEIAPDHAFREEIIQAMRLARGEIAPEDGASGAAGAALPEPDQEEDVEITTDQAEKGAIIIPQLTLVQRKKVKLPHLHEIENLVFQGGGVKGFAYLGALQVLLDPTTTYHIELSKIKRVAGASAGAITSFLLAIGYSFDELDRLMRDLDFFDAFLDDGPTIYTHYTIKYVVGKLLELTKQFEIDAEGISKLNLVIYLVYHCIRYFLHKTLGKEPTEEEIKAEAKIWYQRLRSIAGALLKELVFGDILGTLWSNLLELLDQALQKLMSDLSGILFARIEAKLREIWHLNKDALHELLHAIFAAMEYVFDSSHKGLFSGQKLVAWFEQRLRDKGLPPNLTFLELACIRRSGIKHLYIMALNLSTGHTEVFSAESTPRVRIVDAVRVSLSIPLFFQPYRLDYDGMKDYVYTDGGVLDNYPINIFDTSQYEMSRFFYQPGHRRIVNRCTLGLRLVTDDAKTKYETGKLGDGREGLQADSSMFRYGIALAAAVVDKQESDHLRSYDQSRTVYISCKNVGTVDFNLSAESKGILRTEGQNGALSYLYRLRHDTAYEAQFSRWNFWHSAGLSSLSQAGVSVIFCRLAPIVLGGEFSLFWYSLFSAVSAASADLTVKCLAYSKSSTLRKVITDKAEPGQNLVKVNLQKRIRLTGGLSGLFAICIMGSARLFGYEVPSLKFSLLLAAAQGIATTAITAVDEKYLAAPYVPRLSWQYGGRAV